MEFTIAFINLFGWAIYLISPILLFLLIIIILLGQVVTHIEGWKKFDGIYWSLITATTVGYGDMRPIHKRSKILSIIIAILGIIFTGIILAAALDTVGRSLEKHVDFSEIKARVEADR